MDVRRNLFYGTITSYSIDASAEDADTIIDALYRAADDRDETAKYAERNGDTQDAQDLRDAASRYLHLATSMERGMKR